MAVGQRFDIIRANYISCSEIEIVASVNPAGSSFFFYFGWLVRPDSEDIVIASVSLNGVGPIGVQKGNNDFLDLDDYEISHIPNAEPVTGPFESILSVTNYNFNQTVEFGLGSFFS